MKHEMLRKTLVLLASITVMIAILSMPVASHPPSSMTLDYDAETETLEVDISHSVSNTDSHYIDAINIEKNGETIKEETYESQPSTSGGTYEYSIEASNGDAISVTADCSNYGDISDQIQVTIEPTEMQMQANNNVDQSIIQNHIGQQRKSNMFSQLALGRAAAPEVDASFTIDKMTFKGNTYTSTWKEEDYALIQPKGNKILIVGTHRYGSRAAALYYDEHEPKETTLIHWKDQNNDQKPQQNEIEVIN